MQAIVEFIENEQNEAAKYLIFQGFCSFAIRSDPPLPRDPTAIQKLFSIAPR